MSDVLIKNIEMPKETQCCYTIFPNGKVIVHWDGKVLGEATAIELPPHGQLIDRDAVLKEYNHVSYMWQESPNFAHGEFVHIVYNAPVVVEASR